MAAVLMMLKDLCKLIGGGTDMDLQDIIHVGPTYRDCHFVGHRQDDDAPGRGEAPRSAPIARSIAAVGALIAVGGTAYAMREHISSGVMAAAEAAAEALVVADDRIASLEDGNDWAVSLYVWTIDATLVVRTIDHKMSMALSPAKPAGTSLSLTAGGDEIDIPLAQKHRVIPMAAHITVARHARARGAGDAPGHPVRADGVLTRAGWAVLIQRDRRVWVGVCDAVNQAAVSAPGTKGTPFGFRFIVSADEQVSRMEKCRE